MLRGTASTVPAPPRHHFDPRPPATPRRWCLGRVRAQGQPPTSPNGGSADEVVESAVGSPPAVTCSDARLPTTSSYDDDGSGCNAGSEFIRTRCRSGTDHSTRPIIVRAANTSYGSRPETSTPTIPVTSPSRHEWAACGGVEPHRPPAH